MRNAPECLVAALRYARRGWAVFPLNGKKPFPGSRGFHEATTDPRTIRTWWDRWPHANVGIACDSKRGPLAIDIDGPSGAALLDDLHIHQTREVRSSKHKRHLYFAPIGVTIPRRIRPFGKGVALDVLGDGGYIVAPPSRHPDTGKRYRWLDEEQAILPFPQILLDALQDSPATKKKAPPVPDVIQEGERDAILTSLAGTMRRRNMSEDAILAALREENDARVVPPLPDKDVRRIAKSVMRYTPAGLGEHLTDLGNARRFIHQYSDRVRSRPAAGRRPWLVWDGRRWAPDLSGEVERLAKNTVRSIYMEAMQTTDEDERDRVLKHAAKSEGAPRVRSMLELAVTEPEVVIADEAFDADPWALNVLNGTINLRTGELRPHDKEDLITKLAPVEFDPTAECPRWEIFIHEIMQSDLELVEYVQAALGYSLTGDVREECLFFCYGGGSNGKSKLIETMRALLGDYAQQSDFNTFLTRRSDGPRNDLARMRGARFVTASETQSDRSFDTQVLKLITGRDKVTARMLYQELFEFMPTHKIWLSANHKPQVHEQTEAFWRRLRLLPFLVTFEKGKGRDESLQEKLLMELPGILNWCLAGTRQWLSHGLKEPKAVRKTTKQYREENDPLGEFLAARTRLDPDTWTITSALYRAYTEWWMQTQGGSGHKPLSPQAFGRALSERRDLQPITRKHIRGWQGITLQLELKAG